MDCTRTQANLGCYADAELDPVTSLAVETHLEHCVACQRALDQLGSLRSLIREGAPYFAAPDSLAARIGAPARKLAVAPLPTPARAPWWGWLQGGALVAATAIVTWMAATHFNRPAGDDFLTRQLIAGHARSMITSRLADIASSEGHTVKPWFASRLDYSPPVKDLSTAGFPLVGGRLDYLDQRPVAVLVYTRRKHVIDVFVWPDSGAQATAATPIPSRQGYQVLQWSDGAMKFYAVSDLNAAELKTFAEKFAGSK